MPADPWQNPDLQLVAFLVGIVREVTRYRAEGLPPTREEVQSRLQRLEAFVMQHPDLSLVGMEMVRQLVLDQQDLLRQLPG